MSTIGSLSIVTPSPTTVGLYAGADIISKSTPIELILRFWAVDAIRYYDPWTDSGKVYVKQATDQKIEYTAETSKTLDSRSLCILTV